MPDDVSEHDAEHVGDGEVAAVVDGGGWVEVFACPLGDAGGVGAECFDRVQLFHRVGWDGRPVVGLGADQVVGVGAEDLGGVAEVPGGRAFVGWIPQCVGGVQVERHADRLEWLVDRGPDLGEGVGEGVGLGGHRGDGTGREPRLGTCFSARRLR